MTRPLNVCVYNYNQKANRLCAALASQGHQVSNGLSGADVFLIDTDIPTYGDRRQFIRIANKNEIPVVIYPHGGDFRWEYDGCLEGLDELEIACHLVTGPGHKRLHEKLGLGRRIEVLGWFYSPVLPFDPPYHSSRFLLGPRHPWADGQTQLEPTLGNNQYAFQQFMQLDGDKTVRFFGTPEANGLDVTEPGVKFVNGMPDNSFDEILQADVVLSTETYATLAVALGKPTVMWGQDDVTHRETIEDAETGKYPARWSEYRDELRYPYDLTSGDQADLELLDVHKVVQQACVGGPELDRWKADWIGEQFEAAHLVEILRSCLT